MLVTGGTGFIGRHTLVPLLDAGYEVHLVTRNEPSPPPEVRVIRADLLMPGVPEEVVTRVAPSHLLHMAWFVAPGQVWNSFENVRWVEASLALLRGFARAGGRRAVAVGTCSEYTPTDEPCDEHGTPTQPSTLYGISKDSLRRMARWSRARPSCRWRGLGSSWPMGRMSIPRGSSPRSHGSCSWGSGPPVPMAARFATSCTSDIGAALVSLLGTTLTGPVNVASGRSVTVGEIVQYIGDRLERPELLGFGEITPPPGEPPVLLADVGRLRDEVRWGPSLTLEEGLDQTIAWWEAEASTRSAESA